MGAIYGEINAEEVRMRQLTTPTHIFTVPFGTGIIQKLRLVYAQNDVILLCKELTDCELDGNTITTKLTQEETALIDCHKNYVEVQAHILTVDKQSIVSEPLKIAVYKCVDTEVII